MRRSEKDGRRKMVGRRRKMRLCAVLFTILYSICISCRQEGDTIVYQQSRRWVEKTVAVVAPMSADAATKARFERTAQWCLDNLHQAQLHDTLCITLKLEWHDELTEDLAQLGETLASRDDVMAIIGPFGNDAVATDPQTRHRPDSHQRGCRTSFCRWHGRRDQQEALPLVAHRDRYHLLRGHDEHVCFICQKLRL